ncbi:hypothetical protein B0H13DRAFT_1936616 [Mycena leptocephala]|nr:hypothetical protein B0H13DRAFT_1936616 [Mycena leptocephala]
MWNPWVQHPSFGNIRYHLQENSFDLPRNTHAPQVQRPSTDTGSKCPSHMITHHESLATSQMSLVNSHASRQLPACMPPINSKSMDDNSPRIPRDLTDVSGELTRKQTAARLRVANQFQVHSCPAYAPPINSTSMDDNSPRIPRDLTDVSGEFTRKQTAAPSACCQSTPSPWACRATFSNSFSALVKMTTRHESLVTYVSDELTRKQTAVPSQYLAARRLECPATP